MSIPSSLTWLCIPAKAMIWVQIGHVGFDVVYLLDASSFKTEIWMRTCVAPETRHTNTSLCTRGARGHTPQLAPREADLQRDTQNSKPELLEPDAPAPREGPVRGSR